MPGILDLFGLAATLAVAAPLALFGASELLAGREVGAVFLVLAVALVAVQQLLTAPSDLPGAVLQRVVGDVVEEPEEKP